MKKTILTHSFLAVMALSAHGDTIFEFGIGNGVNGNGDTTPWTLGTPTTQATGFTLVTGSVDMGNMMSTGTPTIGWQVANNLGSVVSEAVPGLSTHTGALENDFYYRGHDASTLAGAITNEDYVSFAITVDTGYELTLNGYQFDIWRNGTGAVDGYTVFHGLQDSFDTSGTGEGTATGMGTGIGNIVSVGSQTGLNVTYNEGDVIEFRIYGYADSAGTANGTTHLDEVRLYGTVSAIPEPSAALQLSGFTYDPVTGDSEVTIEAAANTEYKLVEAADLDFASPDQDPVPLTGASVGTLNGNNVTTDGSGKATVQFNLGTAKDATFLRAETP